MSDRPTCVLVEGRVVCHCGRTGTGTLSFVPQQIVPQMRAHVHRWPDDWSWREGRRSREKQCPDCAGES